MGNPVRSSMRGPPPVFLPSRGPGAFSFVLTAVPAFRTRQWGTNRAPRSKEYLRLSSSTGLSRFRNNNGPRAYNHQARFRQRPGLQRVPNTTLPILPSRDRNQRRCPIQLTPYRILVPLRRIVPSVRNAPPPKHPGKSVCMYVCFTRPTDGCTHEVLSSVKGQP